ncbi:F-box/LRR-repeat protein 12 [Fukomys damarensis]|uniref:F-box/LRR-repeat protein 12 n=1 Tax=Fukomys damarensis TaxID=885580 RepID=UPI0005402043|nr:F-box/LRR-repeat protein 12 [Fukomys damarensis]
MRPKVMWHLLRRYMASRLHSLRMGGYLFSGSQAPQLSPALLRALGDKCPNLKRLCLHVADLSAVPITSLPSTLQTLELHSGLSPQGLALLEGMPALESLCLQGPLITPEMPTPTQIISACLTMPKLRVLELQGLGWEGQEAEQVLCRGLPHCVVIVRPSPKESMDWWM